MTLPAGALQPATPTDVDAILAIEATPGYEGLISLWPRERHLAEMALPTSRYFVWREGAAVEGYVIFQQLDLPEGFAYLRRVAVREPGRGMGAALLPPALDWAFANTAAPAVRLHAQPHNDRGRRLYRRLGFHDEAQGGFMRLARQRWAAGYSA